MSAFEELEKKPRAKRSVIEQCIVDAARLEDMRDGDTTLMEQAAEDFCIMQAVMIASKNIVRNRRYYTLDEIIEILAAAMKQQ